MVLEQKQRRRSVERSKEPRSESTLIWSINYAKGGENTQMGKIPTSMNDAEKMGQLTSIRKELSYFLTWVEK